MSTDAEAVGAPAASPAGTTNPWLIAVVVALAVFMEVLDTTIANVALPYVAGGLGVSMDEATWVVTTYLVANAVIIMATSFLPKRFGRKAYFLFSLGLFTLSSVLCGLAWNLQSLLLFRILQGIGGGGMVPVAQSILADSFPPEKRGQAFALFGIAVVVAPVVGPTLGGWIADNYSWQWNFLINGPVGIAAMALVYVLLQEVEPADKRLRFDWVGFVLVATFLGSLEVVLDRGLVEDWFASRFIVTFSVICALAFIALIPWEAAQKDPAVDVRMAATRHFGAALVVMLATGSILYATTQFMPQLVQEQFGYTATWAGLVLSPGGIVTVFGMIAAGALSARVQPKYLIAAGAMLAAISMYGLTSLTPGLDFWFFAKSRMLLGLGLPLIFLPIMGASYDGLPPGKTDQASALMNAVRNTGGSIGVSIATNVLAHREQFHQNMLVGNLTQSSISYQDTLHQVAQYFAAQGSSLAQAQQQAFAWIGQQVQAQAALMAYVDVFWVLRLIALSAVPLALMLRNVKLGGAAPMAH
jgi:MFS transporter, DHA2 family, multidrug resistance protein